MATEQDYDLPTRDSREDAAGQDLLIRPARHEDLDALLALYAELAPHAEDPLPTEPSDLAATLARVLADPARRLLVAVRDGEVLGTVDVLVAPNLTHHGRPWAIVENVVVAERARSRGVGRALMESVIAFARDAGCYKVQLLSGNERTDAHRFYERLSFAPAAQGYKLYLLRDEPPGTA